ncbi:MAG: HEAT repeat domain-containing protein [Myxococcales bacterium]|nr:HEAT repeat domain-containing protein [Myxococcales bacterium]
MLAGAGAPEAKGALLAIAESSHGATRSQALDALANADPSDPAVAQLLADSLFSGRADEAQSAAWVLGRIGTDDAREALVAALKDDDLTVANAAMSALGQVGSPADVRAALADVVRTGKPELRGQALAQLMGTGAPEALALAEQALRGDDPDLARNVAYSLSNLGGADAQRLLAVAARSSDASVRAASVGALVQAGDDAATDALLTLTRDSDPSVKAQALSSLGQVGSARAVDALVSAAGGGAPEDRIAALQGLGNVDDPRASSTLARAIEERDDAVATAAIWAAYNGGDDVDQALVRAFGNPAASDAVRNAAGQQIRSRGIDVDDATRAKLDELLGPGGYGGYGYGGYGGE